jgi:transposase
VDTSNGAVVRGEPTRRRRTVEEKRRIVEETFAVGASVARVARAHGVNANQVFGWRRQYRQGLLGEGNTDTMSLLPVRVTKAAASEATLSNGEPARRAPSGTIHIEFPKGHLRIAGSPDMVLLRFVLEYQLR